MTKLPAALWWTGDVSVLGRTVCWFAYCKLAPGAVGLPGTFWPTSFDVLCVGTCQIFFSGILNSVIWAQKAGSVFHELAMSLKKFPWQARDEWTIVELSCIVGNVGSSIFLVQIHSATDQTLHMRFRQQLVGKRCHGVRPIVKWVRPIVYIYCLWTLGKYNILNRCSITFSHSASTELN